MNVIEIQCVKTGIHSYICGICLKGYNARQESDYYRESAEMCCRCNNVQVTRKEQPFNPDQCFDDKGNFHLSLNDAIEDGASAIIEADFYGYDINEDSLITSILEEHHDDATVDDLVDLEELLEAVRRFNAKQTSGSFFEGKGYMTIHNQTIAMIKPCAMAAGHENAIKGIINQGGFRITQQAQITLSRDEAEQLYAEHRNKEHFKDLVDFTISGPVLLMSIERDEGSDDERRNVAENFRKYMLEKVRPFYTETIRRNGLHASDSRSAAFHEYQIFKKHFTEAG